ncbi:unnamed protein product [Closterium sp. Naga37s-1]|nr:unnamed protein product [Closterium sp. Naga37s-1]
MVTVTHGHYRWMRHILSLLLFSPCVPVPFPTSLPPSDPRPFPYPSLRPSFPHPSHRALCPYKANFTGVAQFLLYNYHPQLPCSLTVAIPHLLPTISPQSLPPDSLSLQGQFHRCGSALCPYKGNFTGAAQFLECKYYAPAATL